MGARNSRGAVFRGHHGQRTGGPAPSIVIGKMTDNMAERLTTSNPTPPRKPLGFGRDAMVASICGFVVALMIGASYAAVPFYNWFCRATGFNGTTQVTTSLP